MESGAKILSVIVPTYNMEALLGECLDSVLAAGELPLEIVVVNDGSRDRSLDIAREYERRHPAQVRVIDKPNGNYGSTINAALPILRGEYVKILDADDRFDTACVGRFVEVLKRGGGADVVVTPFVEVSRRSSRRVGYDLYSRRIYENDRLYDIERIFADGRIRFFMMHGLCYRTALLRETGYRQSEGISYTDQEWVFYPLFAARTILFSDIALYRYNLAREGQTMDAAVQLRSLGQLEKVAENIVGFYAAADLSAATSARRAFLREFALNRVRIVYRKYLLDMPERMFDAAAFAAADTRLDRLAAACGAGGERPLRVWVNNLLRIDLLARWRSSGRRLTAAARCALAAADRTMAAVHGLLFR